MEIRQIKIWFLVVYKPKFSLVSAQPKKIPFTLPMNLSFFVSWTEYRTYTVKQNGSHEKGLKIFVFQEISP